jgi:hypothetical protein
MTKLRPYVRKASEWFIYLFLVAGFHNIIAGRLHAQAVSFVTAKKSAAGLGFVGSSGMGDFNQDGNQDLAVIGLNSSNVSVLLGNGDGTFQTAVNLPLSEPPSFLVVSYFNGDSIPDLAVVTFVGTISVFLGNGDGTFGTALDSFAGPSPRAIDCGDFNGDHLQDLMVNNENGTAILLGNGNGTFRAPLNTPPPAGKFTVAGYFNDDGILDIVGPSGGGLLVHPGNGDGTFRSPIASPGPFGSFAVGYFNRDAIADLAVGDFVSQNIAILLGNGDGTFRAGGVFSSPYVELPSRLRVDDFNGDTIPDLATSFGGKVSVGLSRGDGTFHALAVSSSLEFGDFLVGDFNGDGIKDLAGTDGDRISVALGYGDGTFQGTWSYELGAGSFPPY